MPCKNILSSFLAMVDVRKLSICKSEATGHVDNRDRDTVVAVGIY